MLKGILIFIMGYLIMAILCFSIYFLNRDTWTQEFKENMKDWKFILLLFVYCPISYTKKIMGEIK